MLHKSVNILNNEQELKYMKWVVLLCEDFYTFNLWVFTCGFGTFKAKFRSKIFQICFEYDLANSYLFCMIRGSF